MLDRSDRICRLADALAEVLGLTSKELLVLQRAAFLAKADLATSLVVELSTLAGQMGRIYALADGEQPEVADAIYEHVLPRHAGDALPKSRVGAVLAGAEPSGSNDPYALRRAATGLIQILAERGLPLDLREVFGSAAEGLATPVEGAVLDNLQDFVARRFEQRLLDDGHRIDLVRAVFPRFRRPTEAMTVLADLEKLVGNASFMAVASAYRRVTRISRDTEPEAVDTRLLSDQAEKKLWISFLDLEPLLLNSSLVGFVDVFEQLVDPINDFFESVMVMAKDETLRRNRLRLLARVRAAGAHLVDWEAVPDD
jgi:glycyl-tRNA synthetase